MFRTVIFDLDGTLLNTLDDLADAGNRVCAAHGWPQHPRDSYRYFAGNGIPNLVKRFSPPGSYSEALLAEFKADYAAHMKDKTAPYPGIPQLLEQLYSAGVQLAVYSNKADELAREVVADYFDAAKFNIIRGARPGVKIKPDAEGTLALLCALRADPNSTLYVGDSNVDVETAHNAGLPCCGVLWGFRTAEELTAAGAEFLAETTEELQKIINS